MKHSKARAGIPLPLKRSPCNKRDGFVGGGQIGYNYQFTPGSGFVIGVEADAQYAGFNCNSDSSSAYYTNLR
jgi:opacity protein-like surface antigen